MRPEMRPEDLLLPTPSGVCCKPGGFYIDPTRPVDKALITHGHSDHARAGHGKVLATQETLDIMRLRYGDNFAGSVQAIRYGETVTLNGVSATFHPAGHVLGSAQIAVERKGCRIVASGDYKNVPDPTCAPFELVPCDVFITEATFGLPVFRHPDPDAEIAKLLHSVALFPERAHLIGAYSLGKAQRVIALIRKAGYREPIYLHGAMETLSRYYIARGIDLGELAAGAREEEGGACRHHHALPALGAEGSLVAPLSRSGHRLRLRLDAGARAGAAKSRAIAAGDFRSRRLGRPARDRQGDRRVRNLGDARTGRCAGSLVRHAGAEGAAARHRRLRRRGRDGWRLRRGRSGKPRMNRFAELLDRLAYEPGRNNKLRLMTDYFRHTPDPERGYALAALTGNLVFQHAKPGMIRALIIERTDPVLFGLSRDFVGDTSETIALMWPAPDKKPNFIPSITDVVTSLNTLGKSELPAQIARWLDALDETGRWALLKLVTGALRVGVSARLAKTAAAALGDKDVTEIELMWSGLEPPYAELFAWLEGRGDKPSTTGSRAVPPRDAGAGDRGFRFREARSGRLSGRMEMGRHPRAGFRRRQRTRRADRADVFAHRRGHFEELSRSCSKSLNFNGSLDGELLILRERPGTELQRAAAAAEPQGRDAEAGRGISRSSARL